MTLLRSVHLNYRDEKEAAMSGCKTSGAKEGEAFFLMFTTAAGFNVT